MYESTCRKVCLLSGFCSLEHLKRAKNPPLLYPDTIHPSAVC